MVSNIFYFHPYLGKIPILTNIFQRGWNHQPANICFFCVLTFVYVWHLLLKNHLWDKNNKPISHCKVQPRHELDLRQRNNHLQNTLVPITICVHESNSIFVCLPEAEFKWQENTSELGPFSSSMFTLSCSSWYGKYMQIIPSLKLT